MGRPDTLGADLHHNRQFPLIKDTANVTGNDSGLMDPPHCAIIKSMVDFSRITRSICLSIYLQDLSVPRTVALAFQIEEDLDRWVDSLPEAIRPTSPLGQSTSLRGAKDAQWVKRQRLVLTISPSTRYGTQMNCLLTDARIPQSKNSSLWLFSPSVFGKRASIDTEISGGCSQMPRFCKGDNQHHLSNISAQ